MPTITPSVTPYVR